jgi:di/tricarboxylate transporter
VSSSTSVSEGPRLFHHWLAHAVVVAALMLLSRADWILSSLYHGDQSVADIYLAVVALFAVVLLVLVPAALLVPEKLSEAALRALSTAAAVYRSFRWS